MTLLVLAGSVVGGDDDAQLGNSVASAGDVNGDGFDDVLVGAALWELSQGKAFLYLGGPNGLDLSPQWVFEPKAVKPLLGRAGDTVASAGDVNGDGFDDVLVTAPTSEVAAPGGGPGRVLLFLGSAAGLETTPAWTALPSKTDDTIEFGDTASSAGDVNGDGFADVIVGDKNFVDASDPRIDGRVLVYDGSAAGLSATPSWTAVGVKNDGEFGTSVAFGDVNGDGFDDIVVGAPSRFLFSIMNYPGEAYVYLGSGTGLSDTPVWNERGEAPWDHFGQSVASADVNGDGLDDIVVGAPDAGPIAGYGKVYVYAGTPSGPATEPTWALKGIANGNEAGSVVAGVGDVNADGYDELAVVTKAVQPDAVNAGVMLFLGSASGPETTPAWTYKVDEAASWLIAMAGAGDVNGDGLDDLVYGNPTVTGAPGQPVREGQALLFLAQ